MIVWDLICSKSTNNNSNSSQAPLASSSSHNDEKPSELVLCNHKLVRLERQVQQLIDQTSDHVIDHTNNLAHLIEDTFGSQDDAKMTCLSDELLQLRMVMRRIRRCRNGSDAPDRKYLRAIQKKIDRVRERVIFIRLEMISDLRKLAEELTKKYSPPADKLDRQLYFEELDNCERDRRSLESAVKESSVRDARLKRTKDLERDIYQVHSQYLRTFKAFFSVQNGHLSRNINQISKKENIFGVLNPDKPENLHKINQLLRLTIQIKNLLEALCLGFHRCPEHFGFEYEDNGTFKSSKEIYTDDVFPNETVSQNSQTYNFNKYITNGQQLQNNCGYPYEENLKSKEQTRDILKTILVSNRDRLHKNESVEGSNSRLDREKQVMRNYANADTTSQDKHHKNKSMKHRSHSRSDPEGLVMRDCVTDHINNFNIFHKNKLEENRSNSPSDSALVNQECDNARITNRSKPHKNILVEHRLKSSSNLEELASRDWANADIINHNKLKNKSLEQRSNKRSDSEDQVMQDCANAYITYRNKHHKNNSMEHCSNSRSVPEEPIKQDYANAYITKRDKLYKNESLKHRSNSRSDSEELVVQDCANAHITYRDKLHKNKSMEHISNARSDPEEQIQQDYAHSYITNRDKLHQNKSLEHKSNSRLEELEMQDCANAYITYRDKLNKNNSMEHSSTSRSDPEELITRDCANADITKLRKALKTVQKWLSCMHAFDEHVLLSIEKQISTIEGHIDSDKSVEGLPEMLLISQEFLCSDYDRTDEGPPEVISTSQEFECSKYDLAANCHRDSDVNVFKENVGSRNTLVTRALLGNKRLSKSCINIFNNIVNERLV